MIRLEPLHNFLLNSTTRATNNANAAPKQTRELNLLVLLLPTL